MLSAQCFGCENVEMRGRGGHVMGKKSAIFCRGKHCHEEDGMGFMINAIFDSWPKVHQYNYHAMHQRRLGA